MNEVVKMPEELLTAANDTGLTNNEMRRLRKTNCLVGCEELFVCAETHAT